MKTVLFKDSQENILAILDFDDSTSDEQIKNSVQSIDVKDNQGNPAIIECYNCTLE